MTGILSATWWALDAHPENVFVIKGTYWIGR